MRTIKLVSMKICDRKKDLKYWNACGVKDSAVDLC